MKQVNVICIKWGTVFGPEYVNTLYNMIQRNTSYKVNFFCFTENANGLHKDIIIKPLPELNVAEQYIVNYAYRKEAALCEDNLGGLRGERVFFFDLDVVIVSNLDELFDYPKEDNFYIIQDWKNKNVGQASCYSWVVGTLGYVKEDFEKNPEVVVKKYGTASQEYLTDKVKEKYTIHFWPKNWFCSFRFHCMPKFGPLRHFIAPKIPNIPGLKAIIFHGYPKPPEAIKGIWKDTKGAKWKRLYKVCKPTKWIEDYWK